MNIKEIFKHWLDITQDNIQRRNFNEIQEELESEIRFAQMNGDDPFEWCHACKLGICEFHFEIKLFTPDDSYGIEK